VRNNAYKALPSQYNNMMEGYNKEILFPLPLEGEGWGEGTDHVSWGDRSL
jgi:hypothetical protein